MSRYRLSTTAQADLFDVLAWTHEHFGEAARKRYEALLVTALHDIASGRALSGRRASGHASVVGWGAV